MNSLPAEKVATLADAMKALRTLTAFCGKVKTELEELNAARTVLSHPFKVASGNLTAILGVLLGLDTCSKESCSMDSASSIHSRSSLNNDVECRSEEFPPDGMDIIVAEAAEVRVLEEVVVDEVVQNDFVVDEVVKRYMKWK